MKTAVAWCMVLAGALPAVGALRQPVRTQQGLLEGVPGRDGSITVFRGVPYAAPPVGEMRWRAPKPPAAWEGVRKAEKFSPACIQNIVHERKPWTREFMAHDTVSEDCLYLNIWTPARKAKAKLPVFVYIHGGGFNEGSGSVPVYDGEGLAKKGVVMVTINYRLSVFGFFAHPELTEESGRGAAGNYGLLDCLAALEWIRDNIAAFGGDPGRVTVAGQSAGSMAVHALVASPLAKGLLHRAIAESGGSAVGGVSRTRAEAEQAGVQFAQQRGAASLAALRAMTPGQLMAPVAGVPGVRFGVVIDGALLPAPIDEIVAQGKQSDVPFIAGGNADEGGAVPNPTISLEAFRSAAEKRFGEDAAEFLKLYPAATDQEAGQANNAASRDQQRMSLYRWTEARAKTSKAKLYTYFWNHVMPGPEAAKYGAFHTSEVPYALNTLSMSERPFTAADHRIADTMSSYWANFAKKGNPNGKGLPRWPAVAERPETTMQIGDETQVISTVGEAARREFWRRYFARPRGAQGAAAGPARPAASLR